MRYKQPIIADDVKPQTNLRKLVANLINIMLGFDGTVESASM